MTDEPIVCAWDGEHLTPVGQTWARRADAQWVVGERYYVEIRQERSQASHRAYFASINEAFQNLPEDVAERFPSPDALRKYALIKAGYCNSDSIVAGSKAEAQRLAAFVRPREQFAVVTVKDAVVTVYTAHSQSVRAMGKADFEKSKAAVLDIVAQMIGTTAPALERNAGAAA